MISDSKTFFKFLFNFFVILARLWPHKEIFYVQFCKPDIGLYTFLLHWSVSRGTQNYIKTEVRSAQSPCQAENRVNCFVHIERLHYRTAGGEHSVGRAHKNRVKVCRLNLNHLIFFIQWILFEHCFSRLNDKPTRWVGLSKVHM